MQFFITVEHAPIKEKRESDSCFVNIFDFHMANQTNPRSSLASPSDIPKIVLGKLFPGTNFIEWIFAVSEIYKIPGLPNC